MHQVEAEVPQGEEEVDLKVEVEFGGRSTSRDIAKVEVKAEVEVDVVVWWR